MIFARSDHSCKAVRSEAKDLIAYSRHSHSRRRRRQLLSSLVFESQIKLMKIIHEFSQYD